MKQKFGERVFRVTLSAGMTCPNIDGKRAKGGCTFCQDASYLGLSYTPGVSIEEQMRKAKVYVTHRHQTEKFIAYFQNRTNTY
ncbi:MAG: TIGR01212 family radical SAM protein, partial [Deltaproteobacteria bacterium]|nr:TIGR01212 family radical SAM protein [Deltaproteobacteria bacterium]